jgi:hypothetical protein
MPGADEAMNNAVCVQIASRDDSARVDARGFCGRRAWYVDRGERAVGSPQEAVMDAVRVFVSQVIGARNRMAWFLVLVVPMR